MHETNKELNVLNDKDIIKLSALVDNFDDSIIAYDLKGIITSYNKGAERLYGYDSEEIVGKTFAILIPDENEFYDILYKVKNGIHMDNWETFRRKKNGIMVLTSVSVSNIYDNEGKITGAVCISRNMEEKQRLIEEQKKSEEKWKFAIEGGNFGVFDWNIKTNTTQFSDIWKKILGYNNNDIKDNYEEWANRLHKDDYNYTVDRLNRHLEKGEKYDTRYRLKCKNGSYKWVRSRGKVVERDNSGKPVRMIGTIEDINEDITLRKKIEESENRLRGIYNSINLGIALGEVMLDNNNNPIDCKCLHINSYMEEKIGLKSENFSCKNIINIVPESGINWLDLFGQASMNGKSFIFEEYNRTVDKYYKFQIYSPNPKQFVLLVTDITVDKRKEIELAEKYKELKAVNEELTATEEELREKYEELQTVYEELTATEEELRDNYNKLEKANEEVERANKAKSQFLANMSHELRTPLNGIMGCTQMLKFTELNEEQKDDLHMIEKSSNNLLALINDILDLSKIEAGKLELRYEKFNFTEQMDYLIKNLIMISKNKDIEVMYYIDPYISKELIGDSIKVKQVLGNLISNAVKFTEHGHIIFKAKLISSTSEETEIQFSVEDTGKGVEEDFKKDIFKKFTQAEAAYTKNYSGAGLGLAISKELAKMMGGDLTFESELGKGSKFYFTAVFINAKDEHYIEHTNNYTIDDNNIINNKNILVVEDHEINMKIVTAFLKQLNYNYACAHNGQEAIDYLQRNKADIVLMDIQMPVLNGYDTTKMIREKEKGTGEHKIIIAMTAYAMIGDKEKFIECGMDDYISKPFNIETLDEILKKVILQGCSVLSPDKC